VGKLKEMLESIVRRPLDLEESFWKFKMIVKWNLLLQNCRYHVER
jgi:hypothetical protein